jgi:hypothetical protein
LEASLREVKAGGQELKRVMKETTDNEFAVTQKLAYEKHARRDLEVSLEVALKSLQNDQVIIAGQEVELTGLKNVTHYAMNMIVVDGLYNNFRPSKSRKREGYMTSFMHVFNTNKVPRVVLVFLLAGTHLG